MNIHSHGTNSGKEAEVEAIVKALRDEGMKCNCDLDNWEPERSTGHSHVCRIHKAAMMIQHRPHDTPDKWKHLRQPS